MFVESWIVIACGVLLLSPVFNNVFIIPYISIIDNVSDSIISHLAIALVPIIVVTTIELFQGHD